MGLVPFHHSVRPVPSRREDSHLSFLTSTLVSQYIKPSPRKSLSEVPAALVKQPRANQVPHILYFMMSYKYINSFKIRPLKTHKLKRSASTPCVFLLHDPPQSFQEVFQCALPDFAHGTHGLQKKQLVSLRRGTFESRSHACLLESSPLWRSLLNKDRRAGPQASLPGVRLCPRPGQPALPAFCTERLLS